MPTEPIVVRFDVTEALPHEITGGEPNWITARVFAPTAPRAGRPVALSCLHGGNYDWRYFHIQVEGRTGYSMAEDMAARGHIVILPDQLGVGESSRPAAPAKINRYAVAAAHHAAITQAHERLAQGTLHPAIPPCTDFVKVGVGHSLGAMTLISQQAVHATFDLTALLGHGNRGAHNVKDGKMEPFKPFPPDTPPYRRANRANLIGMFHWDDPAPEILAADEAMAVEYVTSVVAETHGPATVEDAAQIRSPVFLALGERDGAVDAYTEPSFYSGSRDVTFFVLERSGHCQNFADTRRRLWTRLDRWVTSLAEAM